MGWKGYESKISLGMISKKCIAKNAEIYLKEKNY